MDTAVMTDVDHEMLHAVDHEAGTGREDTQEIQDLERQVQGMDDALRDDNQEIQAQETDNTLREETPEIPTQETDNASLHASLNGCRVEMVPLDAIYVEGDQQEDDLVQALAHSIGLVGLQNPICIVENDIREHAAPYRLVSGRKRYAAFLKLERTTIPAHILQFVETDGEKDIRKALATTEENLVRKHYSLIELCELLGKSKELYEQLHPHTQQGKAPKAKHSGTEPFTEHVPKPLAYLDVAAQQLQKSRGTIWKYINIYNKLITGQPQEFQALLDKKHPILHRLEDLTALANSKDDIAPLVELMTSKDMTYSYMLEEYEQKIDDFYSAGTCDLHTAQRILSDFRAYQEQERKEEEQSKNTMSSSMNTSAPKPADTPAPPSTPAAQSIVAPPPEKAKEDEMLQKAQEQINPLTRPFPIYLNLTREHMLREGYIEDAKEYSDDQMKLTAHALQGFLQEEMLYLAVLFSGGEDIFERILNGEEGLFIVSEEN